MATRTVRQYAEEYAAGIQKELDDLKIRIAESIGAESSFAVTAKGLQSENEQLKLQVQVATEELQNAISELTPLRSELSEAKDKIRQLTSMNLELQDENTNLKKELIEAKSNQAPADERSVATNASSENKPPATKENKKKK